MPSPLTVTNTMGWRVVKSNGISWDGALPVGDATYVAAAAAPSATQAPANTLLFKGTSTVCVSLTAYTARGP